LVDVEVEESAEGENPKKKLGNVWQVLVATKTGDPQKEDTGAFRGINRNQAHTVVFHRSHSHFLQWQCVIYCCP
jgi:hypothetical protein